MTARLKNTFEIPKNGPRKTAIMKQETVVKRHLSINPYGRFILSSVEKEIDSQ